MRRRDRTEVKVDKLRERDDGSIIVDASIGRTGVLPYHQPDGSIRFEFRPPEEVGAPESLKSFELRPVTFFEHPEQMLAVDDSDDTDAIENHFTGLTGSSVTFDGELVNTEIALMKRESIEGISDGVLQLSPGYQTLVVTVDDAMDLPSVAASPGIWKGVAYTHVQREIRGNHVTQLKHGRQGSTVSLRLDSAIEMKVKKDQEMAPETVTLMGQTFEEVPATLAAVLNALMSTGIIPTAAPESSPAEPATESPSEPETSDSVPVTLKSDSKEQDMDIKEREAFQAKLDVANEKITKLEEGQKSLPDSVRKDIAFEVQAASLVDKKPDAFSGKPRREIMEEVLSVKLDGADFKAKSDAYVEARYDILLEEGDETEVAEPNAKLREASTSRLTHKDIEDLNQEAQKDWASRASEPLLFSKKGA